jgi:hypothetical protein
MRFIIFLLIYTLANVFFIIIVKSIIKNKIDNSLLSWSYSVSISLGITFIIGITLLFIFVKEIFVL